MRVLHNVATCLVDLGRTSVADWITVVTPGISTYLGGFFEALGILENIC